MQLQKVTVGSITHSSGGHIRTSLRDVEFQGEELGSFSEPEITDGSPNRGAVLTLYRSSDLNLVVHIENWTHWQGEENSYRLYRVSETDLEVGGEFESLGHACGFGRPLTLGEAIQERL